MLSNNQIVRCDENALRKQSIQNPSHLKAGKWIMIYENNDRVYNVADNIYRDLVKASQQLKLVVEEPYFIELTKESNREELDEALRSYMM